MHFNHFLIVATLLALSLTGCGDNPSLPTQDPPPVAEVATPTALPEPTATTLPTPTSTPQSEPSPTAPPPAPDTPEPAANGLVIPGNPDLDYAQVLFVKASQSSDGTWRFDVTVRHDDQGWEEYADAWQVVHPDTEEVLAERILLHPHDNEQPFTRSESNIVIPPELTLVIVRAKDNVEGFGGQEVIVDLTVPQSDYFEVVRQN